ncbi:RNase P subunit p30 [Pleurostoma richardsiae]|uniref:RNase P subunit p30 n=1 Tax=Pleurostoma richardsiae TaxID=41990 RepID=A0AA38S9G3_9PEZI|nr:RNase P subunit p30 [Pleurostoma richardsiae]
MIYDLNIAWSPGTSAADLERTLKFSSTLGYNVVALNHTLSAPISSQITNPIPLLTPPPQSHPQPPPSSSTPSASSSNNPTSTAARSGSGSGSTPTVLRRATVVLADTTTNHRLPQIAAAYDLLAVRPTTERAFQAACTSLAEPSLISLDLTAFFPFHFRPRPCMAAVNRGLRFELCYAQALAADPRARATFIANAISLVRATRGRGIVLSSGAAGPMALRAPADVVNLFAAWGLPTERGMEALSVNPRGVVVNEGIKRRGFRGVVDIVEVPGRPDGEQQKEGGGDGDKKGKNKPQGGEQQGKQRKGEQKQGVKRGGNNDGGVQQGVVSKRQAKKMKLENH